MKRSVQKLLSEQTTLTAQVAPDGTAWADNDLPVMWWSVGKAALAAAALKLVQAGKLSLDEPLDPVPLCKTRLPSQITLRGLLQHTNNLPDYSSLPAYHAMVGARGPAWPSEEMLQRALAQHAPQGWHYSNVGYTLIRRLIEYETDLALTDALNKLVFHPLHITDVSCAQTSTDLAATAWGNKTEYDPHYVYHGLLISPAISAAKFIHSLLRGDCLGRELTDIMITPAPIGGAINSGPIEGRAWQTAGYGLGLMIGQALYDDWENLAIGHTGCGPIGSAAVYQVNGVTGAAFNAVPSERDAEYMALYNTVLTD